MEYLIIVRWFLSSYCNYNLKLITSPKEIDKAMALALSERATKAKLEGADGEEVIKRPAAKGRPKGTALKRPAAAEVTAHALPKGWKVNLATHLKKKHVKDATSRGSFTSKGHSMGKAQAKTDGLGAAAIVAAGRLGYAESAKFFDEHS